MNTSISKSEVNRLVSEIQEKPAVSRENEIFFGLKHFFTSNAVPAYLESARDHHTR